MVESKPLRSFVRDHKLLPNAVTPQCRSRQAPRNKKADGLALEIIRMNESSSNQSSFLMFLAFWLRL